LSLPQKTVNPLRGGLSYLLISQKRANPRGVWYYRGGGVDAGRVYPSPAGRFHLWWEKTLLRVCTQAVK